MKQSSGWPRVAVVGAGAVGCYFGARLAAAGAPVMLIGRRTFVDAVERGGISIEGPHPLHLHVPVTTDLAACRAADVVLVCVKTVDIPATARALAPHLAADALVLTMQNGVESAEQVGAFHRAVVAAAVYVAVAMPRPGHVRHYGRGDLVIGPEQAPAKRIAALWNQAGVACRVTDNIQGEMWSKLLMNCALNAMSALGHAHYARIMGFAPAAASIDAIVAEVMAVAHAAAVRIPMIDSASEAKAAVSALVAQMPGQHSSMAQDLARGRVTEIDALNGYVCRRGAELGVPTPVNQALFALVKLAEMRRLDGPAL